MEILTTKIPGEAEQVQLVVREVLGKSVSGIYLFGSAIMGGLRSDSDVDVLVLVKESLTFENRQMLVNRLLKVSGKVGNAHSIRPLELTIIKLSDVVPWHYPPRAEFVYGEWLREEYKKGVYPESAYDPDLTIVLKKVIDHSIPMYGDKAVDIFEPITITDIRRAIRESLPGLLEGFKGDERNAMLTLARMWLTVTTGVIVSKDKAAEWAIKQLPKEFASVLNEARLGYLGKIDDNWFGRQNQVVTLLHHMRSSVERFLDSLIRY